MISTSPRRSSPPPPASRPAAVPEAPVTSRFAARSQADAASDASAGRRHLARRLQAGAASGRRQPLAVRSSGPRDTACWCGRRSVGSRVWWPCSPAPGWSGRRSRPSSRAASAQIFRVVVSGVMDVLRARQQIKDEFRMRMTQFRAGRQQPAEVFGERRRCAAQPARQAQRGVSGAGRGVRGRVRRSARPPDRHAGRHARGVRGDARRVRSGPPAEAIRSPAQTKRAARRHREAALLGSLSRATGGDGRRTRRRASASCSARSSPRRTRSSSSG